MQQRPGRRASRSFDAAARGPAACGDYTRPGRGFYRLRLVSVMVMGGVAREANFELRRRWTGRAQFRSNARGGVGRPGREREPGERLPSRVAREVGSARVDGPWHEGKPPTIRNATDVSASRDPRD